METSDITIDILRSIRDEIRLTREDLGGRIDHLDTSLNAKIGQLDTSLNAKIDQTNARLDMVAHHVIELATELHDFKVETRDNFAGVHTRLDGILTITGTHHRDLEARVTRIEEHLELTP